MQSLPVIFFSHAVQAAFTINGFALVVHTDNHMHRYTQTHMHACMHAHAHIHIFFQRTKYLPPLWLYGCEQVFSQILTLSGKLHRLTLLALFASAFACNNVFTTSLCPL